MVTEFSVSWLELSTLEFERFVQEERRRRMEGELAKEAKRARAVRTERKCGQACG